MVFGLVRLKLAGKLSLLVAFPFFFTVGILAYFLRDSQAVVAHATFIVAVVVLLLVFSLLAIIFTRSLLKGIKSVEIASANLALNIEANGYSSNIPETQKIIKAIGKVQQDIRYQTGFAEQIETGNLDAGYDLRHEQDRLGQALLSIKHNLVSIKKEDQQRDWASDGLTKFVNVLQSAKNLKELSHEIIVNLVRTINANQGALYILTDEKESEILEMQACYAFNRSKHVTQKIFPGEGVIGQAFLEKETVYLKDVPDNFVRITSGLGEGNPRNVLIVPLKLNETVVGIVELASFTAFNQHVISFVEKIGESIAHSVSSFRIAENTKRMLAESNVQTEEMRAQEEELRQNQEELQATQEAISRKYDALFKQIGDLNNQSKFDQLKSINSTKKRNIEYYFDIIRNQILTFSEDLMVLEGVKAFKEAFHNTDAELTSGELEIITKNVAGYYQSEFIPKLNDNVSRNLTVADYLPTETRTLLFQYRYISDNPHPTGSKSLLDETKDDGDYSKVHARYHPILRNFLEKFGYYDIFLIDADTGDMIYSVFKEVDFATNLLNGLYSGTNFGKVVKEAVASTDRNFVKLIDFEPYDPSYHAPASFIASVVYDGNEKIGILVFQMPINKINQILTGNNKWREDGLGETGETFIVGDDYKVRSISRQVIEDLEGHLSALKKIRYDDALLQQIRKMQTNILMEEVKTEAVANALNGLTGTTLAQNAFGEKMLTAYAPLNITDVHWTIVSSMTETEAALRIKNLRESSDGL
ncbi:MAG TPA: GAF domain-containing protein [Chryseolinea sp.]|jgi:putative methionine-R-sulfoxide reductase with GAF domain|nr:GAF domain-containing protein [Chryseolinea sp.]